MSVFRIRAEEGENEAAIRRLHEDAFGGPVEAAIVDALRRSGAAILSLVGELDGRVVGHVLFSPVTIEPIRERPPVVALGPMAVAPEHQGRGCGRWLVHEALHRLRAAGQGAVIVLGHPGYYPRLGFERASRFGLRCEFECPDEAFMALELRPDALGQGDGIVRYRQEFRAG